MRFYVGAIIDKFGMRIVYRTIASTTIVTVLIFYIWMDSVYVFYLCVF